MAKESNRELKKQLAEAREDIQQLMLELGKVNKTANTSYEQSPAYLASQNQIKRLEEQNKALEQKNKRLQEENRKLRSQSEQTIREINSAAEDYRDPVQTAVPNAKDQLGSGTQRAGKIKRREPKTPGESYSKAQCTWSRKEKER